MLATSYMHLCPLWTQMKGLPIGYGSHLSREPWKGPDDTKEVQGVTWINEKQKVDEFLFMNSGKARPLQSLHPVSPCRGTCRITCWVSHVSLRRKHRPSCLTSLVPHSHISKLTLPQTLFSRHPRIRWLLVKNIC